MNNPATGTVMITNGRSEMAIPKWSFDFIVSIVIGTIAAVATVAAVLLLLFRVTIIVPCIWLAIMAWSMWGTCKDQGGPRKCLIHFLGILARKQFIENISEDPGSVEIRFGYRLFGCRLLYLKVPLKKIETVEWTAGQAPEFWSVFIWFDHDDPEKSHAQKRTRKPDQEIYCVGPSRRKQKTEALGLALVNFLRRAGATLVPGKNDCTYVRAKSSAKENEERPP